jgi:hypothetical protein
MEETLYPCFQQNIAFALFHAEKLALIGVPSGEVVALSASLLGSRLLGQLAISKLSSIVSPSLTRANTNSETWSGLCLVNCR